MEGDLGNVRHILNVFPACRDMWPIWQRMHLVLVRYSPFREEVEYTSNQVLGHRERFPQILYLDHYYGVIWWVCREASVAMVALQTDLTRCVE